MRNFQRLSLLLGAVFATLPLAGCSHDDHDRSTRTRASRSYDYDRDLGAREAGYSQRPWRDQDGNLHHNPDWKADSDRGRDSNDRDDRFNRD